LRTDFYGCLTARADAVRLTPGADLAATTTAQVRLARPLTTDLRRPWEKPAPPHNPLRPASGAGSGTSAQQPAPRPVHPNPAAPAPADRPARRIAAPPPATTSAASLPPVRPINGPLITRPGPNSGGSAELPGRGSYG
jgi:hypothetical protein